MKINNIAKSALFVVLMIIGANINVSIGAPIPYTLQTMFMLMSGIILGMVYGPLSQLAYLLLGLFGLPIFTQGKGGFAALMSPTFGFLLGFVLGAYIAALLYRKLPVKSDIARGVVSALIAGAIIYIPGILYFYVLQNIIVGKEISIAAISAMMVPFFLPDAAKAVLAGVFGVMVRKLLLRRNLIEGESGRPKGQ